MRRLFFLLALISFSWSWRSIIAAIVNRTIDDTTGDAVTGFRPLYLPTTPGVWHDATCSVCATNPDPRLAFKGTWTAATYKPKLASMSIEMSFKGTAIYIFFILANFVASGVISETACNFTLNGRAPVPFSHKPSQSPGLEYNALVFSQVNLPNDDHKLVISTSGIDDRQLYVNFDYAIYTFDDTPIVPTITSLLTSSTSTGSTSTLGTSTSKVGVGVIAGSAIGGFIALVTIIFLFICFRRQRHRLRDRATTTHTPFPIDVASTSERYREQPQSHSDFLQSGTSTHMGQHSLYDSGHPLTLWNPTRPSFTEPQSTEAVRRARQSEIDNHLRAAKRELRDLKADLRTRNVCRSNTRSNILHNNKSEMTEMHEQMRLMKQQIEYLQKQQQSEWARGLSNEPPPGYSLQSSG